MQFSSYSSNIKNNNSKCSVENELTERDVETENENKRERRDSGISIKSDEQSPENSVELKKGLCIKSNLEKFDIMKSKLLAIENENGNKNESNNKILNSSEICKDETDAKNLNKTVPFTTRENNLSYETKSKSLILEGSKTKRTEKLAKNNLTEKNNFFNTNSFKNWVLKLIDKKANVESFSNESSSFVASIGNATEQVNTTCSNSASIEDVGCKDTPCSFDENKETNGTFEILDSKRSCLTKSIAVNDLSKINEQIECEKNKKSDHLLIASTTFNKTFMSEKNVLSTIIEIDEEKGEDEEEEKTLTPGIDKPKKASDAISKSPNINSLNFSPSNWAYDKDLSPIIAARRSRNKDDSGLTPKRKQPSFTNTPQAMKKAKANVVSFTNFCNFY